MELSTRDWVSFFRAAGIPEDESASYAIIFTKNRIQRDMLPDLNKEYLRDMGIQPLGDIIAILKHANNVHEKNSRASVLTVSLNETFEAPKVLPKEAITPARSSSTVKRLLDHYTQKYKEAEASLSAVPSLPESEEKKPVPTPEKKKIRLSKPKEVQKLEVPLQKKWKVLPEHEGPYKIILPEKSAKLASEKQKQKTIFERLGEATVSSTTDSSTTPTKSPIVKSSPSIFCRLGEISSTAKLAPESDALPYAGVLKTTFSTGDEISPSRKTAVKRRLDSGISISTSNKSSPSRNEFFVRRDLKMLKITTEFSNGKNPKAAPKILQTSTSTERSLRLKRKSTEAPDDSRTLSPKKVRFAATAQVLTPMRRSDRSKMSPSSGFTVVNDDGSISKVNARAGQQSLRAPGSKMASDRMMAESSFSVKDRITLKKTKQSILDRLG